MASPPVLEDSNHMTSRAKTRIGVAVVLLAVAIGGLALLSKRTPETQLEEQPSQKQESLSSGEDTTAAPAAPETSPQISSAQQEPPPPMPVPETPVTPPPPPPPAPVVSKLPPEPQKSAAPPTPHSVTAAPEKPVTSAPPAKPAPEPTRAAPQPDREKPATLPAKQEPVPKSFEVQVGVFTDMENAKQLQAKLAEHGIPSHTETKLQVGPFNTKAEAEAAREKLKALGIGATVVPGK